MNTVGKLLKMAKSVGKDHRTIRTVVAEEVGVPYVKVDTPDLQPGDEVEVTVGLRESEDERIRKMCIAAVNIAASADGGLLHSEASECLSWLEEQKDKNCLACDQHLKGYLAGRKTTEAEKQKEQKPAEWSDEDEKKIGRLRSVVNQLASYTDSLDVNGDYCEGDYAELDTWLKSLRPSWKPSEEQMKALERTIRLANFGLEEDRRKALESLYEDLQKL